MINFITTANRLTEPPTDDRLQLAKDNGVSIKVLHLTKDKSELKGYALPMIDPQGQTVNAIVYESQKPPYLFDDTKGGAVVLGSTTATHIYAIQGLDNAIYLHACLLSDDCMVITSLDFKGMVQAWSENRHIFIIDTLDRHNHNISWLNGINATLFSLVFDVETIFHSDDDLVNILAQTKQHNLLIAFDDPKPIDTPIHKNPYPIHAFGNLAPIVERIAYHAQTPISWAGQAVLGVLATIAQDKVNVKMPNGAVMPTSLYLLTQGESGSGKTVCQSIAYKAIIDHDKATTQAHNQAIDDYLIAVQSLTGKELKQYKQDNPRPIERKIIVTDGTIERILDKFIDDGITAQSWIDGELGAFFGGYSLTSDTAKSALAKYTNLWSGQAVSKDRSQKHAHATGKSTAYDCRFTIDISGQPFLLSQIMNDDLLRHQGLLPRFLLCCEPSKMGARQWNDPTRLNNPFYKDPILTAFWQDCTDHLTQKCDRQTVGYANAQARQFMADTQQDIERHLGRQGQWYDVNAFASRMIENIGRICALFAFWQATPFDTPAIHQDDIQRAYELVLYSLNEVIHYNTNATTKSEPQKVLDKIIQLAGEHNFVLYGVVQQALGRKGKSQVFEPILEYLTAMQCVQVTGNGTKGKPRTIHINPKLL